MFHGFSSTSCPVKAATPVTHVTPFFGSQAHGHPWHPWHASRDGDTHLHLVQLLGCPKSWNRGRRPERPERFSSTWTGQKKDSLLGPSTNSDVDEFITPASCLYLVVGPFISVKGHNCKDLWRYQWGHTNIDSGCNRINHFPLGMD